MEHKVAPPIEGSVLAMAEMSLHDRAIKVTDIVAHAENVYALRDWAQGIEPDSTMLKQELLINYPWLKDRT